MSRHYFECEMRFQVRVLLGHEEATGYILEVKRVGADPGQGYSPFLYASIDDPFNPGDDLDYCREKLEKLGIVVPASMFEAVEEDAAYSKRSALHFPDGRVIEGVPDLR